MLATAASPKGCGMVRTPPEASRSTPLWCSGTVRPKTIALYRDDLCPHTRPACSVPLAMPPQNNDYESPPPPRLDSRSPSVAVNIRNMFAYSVTVDAPFHSHRHSPCPPTSHSLLPLTHTSHSCLPCPTLPSPSITKDHRNIAEHNRWFQTHIYFYLRTALPGFDRHFGVGDSGPYWSYGPGSQLRFLDTHVLRNGCGNWLADQIAEG